MNEERYVYFIDNALQHELLEQAKGPARRRARRDQDFTAV